MLALIGVRFALVASSPQGAAISPVLAGCLVLLFTGLKMMLPEKEEKEDLTNNALLRFLRRHIRITDDYDGEAFFVM